MDKDQVLEIATRYFELVSKELKPRKVLLFGSYARGNWHEFSDIDIAIVVDSIDGDFLDMASMLYRLRRDIDD
ncbi:MAG: nucleotidyltransferase domain-containing protein, partial [Candidatus Phytoplasma sp.]|nr:nucleotidyltransferase domain-containing protein [Phytoplasma sp.]